MKIHIIGIGGIGISALARYFKSKGFEVTGSDAVKTILTENLELEGIHLKYSHASENLESGTNAVFYSEAVPKSNPELKKARKLRIPCKTYFEGLGDISKKYYTIAVAGTHGKTTVSAMVSLMLANAKKDPICFIGTTVPEFNNKNIRIGDSRLLVAEACEYRESFLHLHPNIIILLTCEAEHLDYYKTEKKYIDGFRKFVNKLSAKDILVYNSDDKNCFDIAKTAKCRKIKVSHKHKDIIFPKSLFKKTLFPPFTVPRLKIPGCHNIANAMMSAAAAQIFDIDINIIEKTLMEFNGIGRRFEKLYEKRGIVFYDDYGHHPTEIKATLCGARDMYPKNRIILIYQPHQHSRTHYLLKKFEKCFFEADIVVIPNIYKCRDSSKDIACISAKSFAEDLQKHHPDIRYGNGLRKSAKMVKEEMRKGDVIIIMGAGDIAQMREMF